MSFSVVIPTLQRSPLLGRLLTMLLAEDRVAEVIVINNAPAVIDVAHPRLRVLDQDRNIYVNAAWNLGVDESKSPLICIANDDLLFFPSLFATAERALRLPIGILGPSPDAFTDVERGLLLADDSAQQRSAPRRSRVPLMPTYRRTEGFGTLMFMRRDAYAPIPPELRIWFGDDYLFHQQTRRNALFCRHKISTPMSTTSHAAEFNPIFWEDREAYLRMPKGSYDELFGREPRIAKAVVHKIRSAVGR